jgi:hypothetical protein
MNTDYKRLMDEAEKAGNYKLAAQYEQLRNQKIAAMNQSGTNPNGYTQSNDFYGWIDGTNHAADIQKMISEGADKSLVADALGKRVEKASTTKGMEDLAYDDIYDSAIAYLMSKPKEETFANFTYASAPTYADKYQKQIDELLNGILNREDFSYDVTKDPLYAQYAQQYQTQGQRSMKDTLGQLSARTGGMASSYAASAAQQAGDYHMSQLSNKVPELYQLAYGMYLDEKENEVENLGLLKSMSDSQYGRYRDTMNDWRNDRNFAYGAYRDDISDQQWQQKLNQSMADTLAQYGDFSGYLGLGYSNAQVGGMKDYWQSEYDKGNSEDAYDKALAEAKILAQYGDFSGYKALGFTDEQIANMQGYWDESTAEPEAGYKPTLTWPQVKAEIDAGNASAEVLRAYEYYMGESYNPEYAEDGYDETPTPTGTGGYNPSAWGHVFNNIRTNLREGRTGDAEEYLDQIAGGLSAEQWEQIKALLEEYGV